MWANIRYNFFNKGTTNFSEDPIEIATVQVEPYGLYVSPYCDAQLAQKAREAFSNVYLGCIH